MLLRSRVNCCLFCFGLLLCLIRVGLAGDPYVFYDWTVSYITASPLGVKQQVTDVPLDNFLWFRMPAADSEKLYFQVIGIEGQFPGPILNVTTNWNVVVNVKNNLDEPFLLTWNGIQQRKNSWQDGVSGTNCPIPAGWNWTYQFQVKDQIGSFFYFPSLGFQRAAGGYGGIIVNNREVIPVPFGKPDGDITLFISDWYIKSHKELRDDLESGNDLGAPDGVLFNGLGPYQFDRAFFRRFYFALYLLGYWDCFEILALDSSVECVFQKLGRLKVLIDSHFKEISSDAIYYLKQSSWGFHKGKTYRLRVHNVGISTSLNFRIQNHNLVLVETEGSYTVQQNYSNMDIHVGQSYSFLVTMDQDASSDYYIVASPRFVNASAWTKAPGVSILHTQIHRGLLQVLFQTLLMIDTYFSMNQARSIRWNVSAGAARPNPQGSFRYGDITVTDVYVIINRPAELIDGKRRTTLNGISYVAPSTPVKLAQQFTVPGVFKLDFPNRFMNRPAKVDTSLINGTFKGFMEIIFQNNDTSVQSYHLDGYAFFVVGMDYGVWTENSRSTYNKWDGVARCTTQVFPGAWTAILVSLDNAGMWNLRTQNLDSWYLGQEVYVSVVNPENDNTEVQLPENAIYCGILSNLQRDQARRVNFSAAPSLDKMFEIVLVAIIAALLAISGII
ncbi:UNVERIFIED_CONTAM: Monocopper oxidase-like protein SKU5 [Sesamum radiatum]|uniref:Monocopper oxidase-like protein SKU5 n=1 Tax=Sesamum radiatum TaxID=300843 RepID=A0AAW2W508_SESRA